MEWIIATIGIIIGIIGLAYGAKEKHETKLHNDYIINERENLKEEIRNISSELEVKKNNLKDILSKEDSARLSYQDIEEDLKKINTFIDLKKQEKESLIDEIARLNNTFNAAVAAQKYSLSTAKDEYLESLEMQYNQAEKEHDEQINKLNELYNEHHLQILTAMDTDKEEYEQLKKKLFETYAALQQELMEKTEKEYAATVLKYTADLQKNFEELEKIRATRIAAFEAFRKEQEIKEQRSFYCLQISDHELADIIRLNDIKPLLHNPRVLSMLIWSTYYQKPMTALCNNILGTAAVCGIYKITNLNNNMCYIGQAVNIADRWKQHAKCGLDIDTPSGNKLYKAMISEGIQNFSWELLETCPREQLNEKERYYIELYDSTTFGYNSLSGIKS